MGREGSRRFHSNQELKVMIHFIASITMCWSCRTCFGVSNTWKQILLPILVFHHQCISHLLCSPDPRQLGGLCLYGVPIVMVQLYALQQPVVAHVFSAEMGLAKHKLLTHSKRCFKRRHNTEWPSRLRVKDQKQFELAVGAVSCILFQQPEPVHKVSLRPFIVPPKSHKSSEVTRVTSDHIPVTLFDSKQRNGHRWKLRFSHAKAISLLSFGSLCYLYLSI